MDVIIYVITYGLVVAGAFMLAAGLFANGRKKSEARGWGILLLPAGVGVGWLHHGIEGSIMPFIVGILLFIILMFMFGAKRY